MTELIYKEESYKIIGCCLEVYNNLGKGFLEIVYKDALEYEFRKQNIPFSREKQFDIIYKDVVLAHKYFADFIVYDKIILEVKHCESIAKDHFKQTINYLKASSFKLGLICNFGESSFNSKRIIF